MNTFAGLSVNALADIPPDHFKALIYGGQGSGKSTLAASLAECGPLLYLDMIGEHGTRSFVGSKYEKNIEVLRPSSVKDLDDVFWELNKGEHKYKSVVIDSVTSVQKLAMKFIQGFDETAVKEIRQGASPADQRMWGQTLDIMVDLATFWFGLSSGLHKNPMHVVMLAQTKVKDDDIAGGGSTFLPDVQKGAIPSLLAAPDYVMYTEIEEDMDAIGDDSVSAVKHIVRFGAHPGYRTKARVPIHLQGKMPAILGRKNPANLVTLGRVLGVGGMPAKAAAPAKKATSANAG